MGSITTAAEANAGRAGLALIQGDLSKLTEAERLHYYQSVCASVGLNPTTKPLGYLSFQGKLILYATKNCTDQLRSIHGVSLVAHEIRESNGILFATVTMRDSTGRTDTDLGAVVIDGLRGESLANAWMKALTKAKRRCTLSLCGLSLLDETETDTMPGSRIVESGTVHTSTGEPIAPEPVVVAEKPVTKPVSKGMGKPAALPDVASKEKMAKLVENADRRDKLLGEFTALFNKAKESGSLPGDWKAYIKAHYAVTTLKDASVEQLGHLIDWVAVYAQDEEPFTEPGIE